MDVKGIDVSSYQGNVDWSKVKANGYSFAILKVIRKDLNADKQFENNFLGCRTAGVEIKGVYNYSYATSVEKAKTDAKRVLDILNGRKLMVWLDVEDECQKNLGSTLIDIINAYAKVITSAGYEFGVYTGYSFYNTYIKKYGGVPYKLWIARYGTNNGTYLEKNRPTMDGVVAWQYSSKASVNGVSGNCDVNLYWGGSAAKATNPYKEPITSIKKGSKGEGAKWVQWELVESGYQLKIDGIIGLQSSNSIIDFQRRHGLQCDGIVGKATRKKLKEV